MISIVKNIFKVISRKRRKKVLKKRKISQATTNIKSTQTTERETPEWLKNMFEEAERDRLREEIRKEIKREIALAKAPYLRLVANKR